MSKISIQEFRALPLRDGRGGQNTLRAVAGSAFAANTAGVAALGGRKAGQGKAKSENTGQVVVATGSDGQRLCKCGNEFPAHLLGGVCRVSGSVVCFQYQPQRAKRKNVAAKPKLPTEHEEQVFLMEWADQELFKYPQLSLLFAIPNGAKLPYRRVTKKGVAISHERRKMLKEGMRAGVPDLMMAYPSKGFHGLFIEMKRAEKSLSTVSEAQRDWITNLCANGYRAEICYGWEAARDVILDYLGAK